MRPHLQRRKAWQRRGSKLPLFRWGGERLLRKARRESLGRSGVGGCGACATAARGDSEKAGRGQWDEAGEGRRCASVLPHLRSTQILASEEQSCKRKGVRSSGSAGAGARGNTSGARGDAGAKEPESGAGAGTGPSAAEAGTGPAEARPPNMREKNDGPAAGDDIPRVLAPALGRELAPAAPAPCPAAASAAKAGRSSTHKLISASAMIAVSPAWSHCGKNKRGRSARREGGGKGESKSCPHCLRNVRKKRNQVSTARQRRGRDEHCLRRRATARAYASACRCARARRPGLSSHCRGRRLRGSRRKRRRHACCMPRWRQ